MAAITTRQTAGTGATVNGAPLSNAQLDTNFISMNTELVDKLSASTPVFPNASTRVQGDMSNGTYAFRVMFQSSTANGNSDMGIVPNGTGTSAAYTTYSVNGVASSAYLQHYSNATETGLISSFTGAASYLPFKIYTGGTARMTISTAGDTTFSGTVTASSYSGSFPWASITGKPTTISGYGITDIVATYAKIDGTNITGTPTYPINISGAAASIPNAVLTTGSYTNPSWLPSVSSAVSATTAGTCTGNAATATNLGGGTQANVILGKQQSMSSAAGASNGSFVAQATGTGDANLAGVTFLNTVYGINLGIRADGYFLLGGYSRAQFSWYSDPSGNMVAAGNVTAYSDPKLKENFTIIASPFDILNKLDGGTFNWKKGIPQTAMKEGKRDYGLRADQVEAVMPEIVSESISIDDVKYKMVSYEKMIPVLLEAVKELRRELSEAQAQIATLSK